MELDPWYDAIAQFVDVRVGTEFTTNDGLNQLGIEQSRRERTHEMRVGAIFRFLGCERRRESGGKRRYVYSAPPKKTASRDADKQANADAEPKWDSGEESARPAAGERDQSTATVNAWQHDAARLDPSAAPCQGFFAGEWAQTCNIIKTFLASPHELRAARCGWSGAELAGVSRTSGAHDPNSLGVLICCSGGPP